MFIFFGCLYMFWLGLIYFYTMKKHILMMLMVLEFMSLSVLLMIINFLVTFLYDSSIIIYFIIVMVCEAVMGLVLLTLLVRTHGNDYLKVSSIYLC
uniref:NADH-ubiquinone oxidoreductase chain 4L n=1 Tax=Freysuila caesalpiniae TaxID=2008487 RepID=A0A344A2C7_9HEMI|nr:NADH dehydrogenase subunit 4L [Freysuila caesalpiniae]AWU48918.1 NADH dehydrogenase subunit 4L [Freysuila caesalpiniae]